MIKRTPIGLILCGGYSSRMGRDKGLLVTEGQSWVRKRYELLREFTDRCLISIRKEQRAAYQKENSSFELVEDVFENQGPISGILSAHLGDTTADYLVIACDMPILNPTILVRLLEEYRNDSGKSAYAWRSQDCIEPFPAIYTSELLKNTFKKWNSSSKTGSPSGILKEAETKWIEFDSSDALENAFINYNTPNEIGIPSEVVV
ncbi:molybdenum cofactor guanylyltransferase [Leptospira sanjuanensis]|uniref:molybdenum cofactor guanylyltransferase n=1 Tax=Leptospira sanjuanensis TaxID=2879643 RepID=UPI001EE78DDF|nr:molybdenum cofactor guanylyltransferase [Leptospira sanjuanensis]MCG6166485.1 molybdenum cofactor guanylyltransferase [Leptospira sanjuanensis]